MKTALIQFKTGTYKIRGADTDVSGMKFPLIEHFKRRMEESRLAHEKEVAKIRMQRRQFRENMKLIGIIFGWGATCLGVLMSALYFYTNF